MISLLNGGPVIVLYSDATGATSHCVRLVLAEKDVETEIRHIDEGSIAEALAELNPYGTAPALVDRDLVLYDTQIILEYLDERFPHPSMMPVDPASRAINRQLRYRIARDLYEPVGKLDDASEIAAAGARKTLYNSLMALEPVFSDMPYFMSEEYTLVDCCMAPLLWRLGVFNIRLPAAAKSLRRYGQSLFERDAFQSSLTEAERIMGDES